MNKVVVDASAVLAHLRGETGGDWLPAESREVVISAVNLSEVVAKLIDHGDSADSAWERLQALELDARPFDDLQALAAGALRASTRSRGLSLGDRCCLALALKEGAPVLTADAPWASLSIGVAVELIR